MIEAAQPYRTLIVDPPWPMQKIRRRVRPLQVEMPYKTMTLDEIAALPIGAIAAPDAHLFLWTTQRFLPHGFTMLRRWGFRYVCALVWHKAGGFQPVGLPQYNCEFVLYKSRRACGNASAGHRGSTSKSRALCGIWRTRAAHMRRWRA